MNLTLTHVKNRPMATTLALLLWFVLWCLCCSLPSNPAIWLLGQNPTGATVATLLCVGLLAAFALTQPQTWSTWFPRRRWSTIGWVIVGLLAATVWLHYHLALPWFVYVPWMAASVFWQQCVTFGWLFDELRERVSSRWLHATLMTAAFVAGHVLVLGSRFANPGAIAFIAALGVLFWFLRHRTGSLQAAVLLHCAFYFIAC